MAPSLPEPEPMPATICCRTALALLCLLVVALPAHARTTYDVEIIVFENVDVPADPGERWRPEVVLPRFDRVTSLDGDDAEAGTAFLRELPEDFIRLDDDELRLKDKRRRLDDSSRYRVLRHIAWQQPGLDPEEAVAVRVRAGEPFEVDVPIRDAGPFGQPLHIDEILLQGLTPDIDAANGVNGTGTSAFGGDDDEAMAEPLDAPTFLPRTRRLTVYPLDGSIRILVRRYLHAHTDLYFTAPVEWQEVPASAMSGGDAPVDADGDDAAIVGTALSADISRDLDGQPLLSFPVHQQRRMRSRELHYLDHPVVGVLVLVTPRES